MLSNKFSKTDLKEKKMNDMKLAAPQVVNPETMSQSQPNNLEDPRLSSRLVVCLSIPGPDPALIRSGPQWELELLSPQASL